MILFPWVLIVKGNSNSFSLVYAFLPGRNRDFAPKNLPLFKRVPEKMRLGLPWKSKAAKLIVLLLDLISNLSISWLLVSKLYNFVVTFS
jgi:hypothetical protein